MYHPREGKCAVASLADCPMDADLRKDYFGWLETKYSLIGNEYALESYADYLKAKEVS